MAALQEQPAGERQQRQGDREAIGEDAQFLPALGGGELLLRGRPQFRIGVGLGRLPLRQFQAGPVEGFEPLLDRTLGGFQRVEALGPRDEAGILIDPLGGVPGLQPVREGLAGGGRGGAGRVEGEPGLLGLPSVVVLLRLICFRASAEVRA